MGQLPEWELRKSQNNLEEGLIRLLKSLMPDRVRVVVLADRGFGRAELARACGQIGLHFVIRVKPDAGVRHPRYRGLLCDYPVRKGVGRVLRGAAYRLSDPVTLNVVIRWKRGLPARRDGPWFLITDLPGNAAALTELYARRVAVEELSRDGKSLRNGFALRQTQVTRAGRFDRLLLVLALAYRMPVGLGLLARRRRRPAACGSNRAGECSAFTGGRVTWRRISVAPATALAAVIGAVLAVGAKWG